MDHSALQGMSVTADIARTIRDGFDKHYRLFRETSARAKYRFVRGRLGGGARGVERAHRDVRPARRRGRRRRCARASPRRSRDECALAGDEARVHRPPPRAPAARVRRDVLQLGRLPRAAIAATTATTTSSAAPPSPPSTSTATSRRTAATTRRSDGPADARSATCCPASASRARSRTSTATCACVVRALRERFPRPVAHRTHNFQIQVLSSLFFRNKAAYVVGRGDQRQRRVPVRRPARCTDADGIDLRRRAAPQAPSTSAASSASRARTSWSTWRCPRPTSRSCRRCCRASRRPSSTRCSACRSRARRSSSAISWSTCSHSTDTLRGRAGHQGAW